MVNNFLCFRLYVFFFSCFPCLYIFDLFLPFRSFLAQTNPIQLVNKKNDIRRLVSVMVIYADRVAGSGLIFSDPKKGLWIATNKHVIQSNKFLCIQTYDGVRHPGIFVEIKELSGKDLAFIWINPKVKYLSANKLLFPSSSILFPRSVTAVGFPFLSNQSSSVYTERKGFIVSLLPRPLEDGLELTYSSDIDKGMSGGGIFFSNNTIAGLNSVHSNPLWDFEYRFSNGQLVPPLLSKALQKVAIGIPSSLISESLPLLLAPNIVKHQFCK